MRTLNNETLELVLFGKVINALLEHGYRVTISDQDGGGLFVYALPDNGETIPAGGYKHWVTLVPGNGPDFISDYTTNLERVLKDVNAFAAAQIAA